ncbi:MAG: proteasome beta-type subunit [Actinomycetota bacterium]|jgi:proteasome beta subunit
MNVPMYTPANDPGSSFVHLLRTTGIEPFAHGAGDLDVPHGTTCVALRYRGGVVIAGDRRATAGHLIRSKSMDKVVQADEFSGVAISGAAGPAVEMIKLFQLQLEHYEKMEGHPLSLEGKANQLSFMIRNNMPAAMQGLAVLPLFAGFEPQDGTGHIWDFDMTGGRYEEREFVAIGSGSLHAGTVIKVGWRSSLDRDAAVGLACRSLWEAAEADAGTGGPDLLRGVYPVVATITSDGWTPVADAELDSVFRSIEDEVKSR